MNFDILIEVFVEFWNFYYKVELGLIVYYLINYVGFKKDLWFVSEYM